MYGYLAAFALLAMSSIAMGQTLPPGTHPLTYVSSFDHTEQPYNLFLPTTAIGEPLPLVVALHGKGANWTSWFEATPVREWAEKEGYAVVCPHGRGDWFYLGAGEKDVFDVIEEVAKRHPIDRDRIYLMGHSMGGWGTWHLAGSHPDVFAAIVPMSGWAALDLLTNLKHTPPFAIHGDADTVVPVKRSRGAVLILGLKGVSHRYLEVSGTGHESSLIGDSLPQIGDWLRHAVRENAPTQIHLSADTSSRGRAWWLSIRETIPTGGVRRTADDIIRLDPSRTEVQWKASETTATLTIETKRVGELSLDFGMPPLSTAGIDKLRVDVDGQTFELRKPTAEQAMLLTRGERGGQRLMLPGMKWSYRLVGRNSLGAPTSPVLGKVAVSRENLTRRVGELMVGDRPNTVALLADTHFLPEVPKEEWTLDDVLDIYVMPSSNYGSSPYAFSGSELLSLIDNQEQWMPAWWSPLTVVPSPDSINPEAEYTVLFPYELVEPLRKHYGDALRYGTPGTRDNIPSVIYRALLASGEF